MPVPVVLTFGMNGLVASRLTELATTCTYNPPRHRVDVTDQDAVLTCLRELRPDVVLNAAAYTDVTQAWRDAGNEDGPCYRVNVVGAENVARACQELGIRLLHVSSDYVFSGDTFESYSEADSPDASSWYGLTKALGEVQAVRECAETVIVRIASPYRASYPRTDLARSILDALAAGRPVARFDDIVSMPAYVDDVCAAVDHLAVGSAAGVFHATGPEALSPYAFAIAVAKTFGYPASLVVPTSHAEYASVEANRPYPVRLELTSSRLAETGFVMPSLADSLERMRATFNASPTVETCL